MNINQSRFYLYMPNQVYAKYDPKIVIIIKKICHYLIIVTTICMFSFTVLKLFGLNHSYCYGHSIELKNPMQLPNKH